MLELVRNMGRLGIEVLCYNWMAVVPWSRTSSALPARGGAPATGFDLSTWRDGARRARRRPSPRSSSGRRLAWFLERAVPVAEEAGVRLALHPDDPPLSPLRGIGRIIRSLEAYDRVFDLQPSPANGMTHVPGQRRPDDRRPPGRDPTVRRGRDGSTSSTSATCAARPSDSSRRSSTTARPTWRPASAPTSRLASTRRCAPTTHPALTGDDWTVPGYPTLGRLHAVGYVQGLLAGAGSAAGEGVGGTGPSSGSGSSAAASAAPSSRSRSLTSTRSSP